MRRVQHGATGARGTSLSKKGINVNSPTGVTSAKGVTGATGYECNAKRVIEGVDGRGGRGQTH